MNSGRQIASILDKIRTGREDFEEHMGGALTSAAALQGVLPEGDADAALIAFGLLMHEALGIIDKRLRAVETYVEVDTDWDGL